MTLKSIKIHIGLRTVKTVVSIIIAMLLVDTLGTSSSKLMFAMMGAMAAVQPTFKESVESCITQIVGVLFGAIAGLLLDILPVPELVSVAIGILMIITLYNILRIQFSPSLSCVILVMVCTTADLHPIRYAVERIWDTAIGLSIGIIINMLVFPYDNSQKIRTTAECLDKELIRFLEELFDGDHILPDVVSMEKQIGILNQQLHIFSNQKLWLRLKRQRKELEDFRSYEGKAHALVAQMEVLCRMESLGRLNEENRRRLIACGANIQDERILDAIQEKDVVTNYHVSQILTIRRELLEILRK